ncbi:hypothetical protein N657DRAFT_671530 [Parathielavia appendiculata]|uniref:Uncharacterized protein n=1 Tax=Parathielavia appendiculata TaxID=2587402 RepID=A0AAN6U297_9PEZI|nr:hypothetical protein N657DRAFT_671530 [Parathielavia appendiculata]
MAQPPPLATRPSKANSDNSTQFFGSQIGGGTVINYGYTDMPWKLMAWDIYYFFKFFWAIPYILWPLSPADSGELSELSPTLSNVWCIAIHVVLCAVQLAGILALPCLVMLPVWAAAMTVAAFLLLNKALCMLLNGEGVEYHSDPKYAPALPEHAHEQWIFINGVAAGAHWMQGNLNRLAVTFKRPVLGIHNKTAGILFDVLECLLQRNWGYATKDVRVCYSIIKQKLYNPQYSKVIFILHSQGGIQGSLILDWLLQELPQDILGKLEVYTFGNAANHFNNPHRHVRSQTLAKRNPLAASVDSTQLDPNHAHHSPVPGLRKPQPYSSPNSSFESSSRPSDAQPPRNNENQSPITTHRGNNTATTPAPLLTSSTATPHPSDFSDRAIGHIEHYAHTTDFVALWGVLHFATSLTPSPLFIPRFIGRVFARTSLRGGHQMVQHYLDGMFPLRRDPVTGELVRDGKMGVPWGAGEEGNEFMESEVLVGVGNGEGEEDGEEEVAAGVEVLGYRNGRSPEDAPPE